MADFITKHQELVGIGVFDFGDMVETARVCNLVRH